MSTVQEIESAISRLFPAEQAAVRDWLNDLADENAEVSDAFQAKVGRAREELDRGEIARTRLVPDPAA